MTQSIAILGAGGFAREAYWHLLGANPSARVVFVDDSTEVREIVIGGSAVPVVKDWRFKGVHLPQGPCDIEEFIIAVGDPKVKRLLAGKAIESGLKPAPTVIHPRAIVQDPNCRIEPGGVITPGCVITTNVRIGFCVILNLNSTVGHDAVIGDYVTVNPGTCISGNVILGDDVLLGTGTVIRDKVRVAPGVVAGAQTCIVKNIDEPNIVVAGVPAKPLR